MSLVSIRGAITVLKNEKDELLEATKEMLETIIKENEILLEEIVQVHFSSTKDLDAAYPAVAARAIGITASSLMCFQEMHVEGSLEKCIRVDMLVDKDGLNRQNAVHVYLRDAKCLRLDLAK